MDRHFNKGDILLRQGDASDYVLRIKSGWVEILREVGDTTMFLAPLSRASSSGRWV
jgi:CRP-like cAMP-binding protein